MSEFHDLSFGANDAAATVAASVLAADIIGRTPFRQALPKQIMFLFADADEWGASGSTRFIHDLILGRGRLRHSNPVMSSAGSVIEGDAVCEILILSNHSKTGLPFCVRPATPPTTLYALDVDDIDTVISVDQIGLDSSTSGAHDGLFGEVVAAHLFVHPFSSLDCARAKELSDSVIEATAGMSGVSVNAASGLSSAESTPDQGCSYSPPPAPLSFMTAYARKAGEAIKFNGFVLAGYDKKFRDPRHHTRLDNSTFVSRASVVRYGSIFT